MATLPPDGRGRTASSTMRRYDWAAIASKLTAKPGQWVLCASDVSSGVVHYVRTGKQSDMASLIGHLDLRVRNSVNDGSSTRGELWGRYTPKAEVKILSRGARTTLTDEQVVAIREEYATGAYTCAQLGDLHGVSGTHVSKIVLGKARAAAGGPIAARQRTHHITANI